MLLNGDPDRTVSFAHIIGSSNCRLDTELL